MRNLTAAAFLAVIAGTASADIIISEVVDGDLTGGNPKFVEITNTGGSSFTFSSGGIIIQANDSSDVDVDVDLTGVTLLAGESFVIASSSNDGINQFQIAYGFGADLYNSLGFGNGDDRYMLNVDGNVVDIFGTFGSRSAPNLATYNYLDSFAYRAPTSITGDGTTYVQGNWVLGGVAALDAANDAARIALLQSLTTPGTHDFVPAPASAALLGLGGLMAARRRR